MSVYPGTTYRYFSIDQDHDVSGDTLRLGLSIDALTETGEYVPNPPARLTSLNPPPATGFTRYWWRLQMGIGQPLGLVCGQNRVLGQLVDSPETEPHKWVFNLPYFPVAAASSGDLSGPAALVSGVERWYGPYTLSYNTAGLYELPGHQLFTPKAGDWLVDFRIVVREYFVNPDGGQPRFAVGWWADSGQDLFGTDSDLPLAVADNVQAAVTVDLLTPRPSGGISPCQFLSATPLYVNVIDGTRDPLVLERPQPIYDQPCTAGQADLYFKIHSNPTTLY